MPPWKMAYWDENEDVGVSNVGDERYWMLHWNMAYWDENKNAVEILVLVMLAVKDVKLQILDAALEDSLPRWKWYAVRNFGANDAGPL